MGIFLRMYKKIEDIYTYFTETLLQIRDRLNNILFIIIGTSTDWERYTEFYKKRLNFPQQLSGFIVHTIDLAHLSIEEGSTAIAGYMNAFWTKENCTPPTPTYPFSKEFFQYMLSVSLKDMREAMNTLSEIWLKFNAAGKSSCWMRILQ